MKITLNGVKAVIEEIEFQSQVDLIKVKYKLDSNLGDIIITWPDRRIEVVTREKLSEMIKG